MPHIFISYAKKDTRKLAIALSDALNNMAGVTTWVDRSLRAGSSWELQIQKHIESCDAMIVLYSPDINRHKQGESESYVLTEIAYAKYTAKKLIIPVMAQTTDAPISLTMEHYIDFTIDGLELDDLVGALCDELEIDSQLTTTTPPTNSLLPVTQERSGEGSGVRAKPASPSTQPPPVRAKPASPTSESLMPKPFDWIKIPAGTGTMKTDEDVTLTIPDKDYWIAKYPVTNAQFRQFIDAGGYKTDKWWTPQGLKYRKDKNWTQPRYWDDSKWNGDTQPVVGVSWFESVAFCLWLSDVTGEKIMLPTEDQWQYAAQGSKGLTYPWGNDWSRDLCNNNVDKKGIGKTSPVTQYEGKGDSPFGVVDMAGNVWEWCLTDYNNRVNDVNISANKRCLRGGSWVNNGTQSFRADNRFRDDPDNWDDYRGFRFLLSHTYS